MSGLDGRRAYWRIEAPSETRGGVVTKWNVDEGEGDVVFVADSGHGATVVTVLLDDGSLRRLTHAQVRIKAVAP